MLYVVLINAYIYLDDEFKQFIGFLECLQHFVNGDHH